MRSSGGSTARLLRVRNLSVLAVAVVSSCLAVGCGRSTDAVRKSPLCAEERPSSIQPFLAPLPEQLRNATWGNYYSGLSDAEIAQTSNLTREQLDIRATLQVESELLIPWLTLRYPNEIGQTWLDRKAGSIVVTSTEPDAMRNDPQLALYPHHPYVTINQAKWSTRKVDVTLACLAQRIRIDTIDPQAQIRFYQTAGEIGIEAADNEAGRAALANPLIAEEVAASEGALRTKLHSFEAPRTDG